ncbi:MAG TPA: ABC transporter substrate-binding protein, partial [Actinomycetota bacterium]|nr:ABC transporter substrate-binding protein [Actinomycetota bacterium]
MTSSSTAGRRRRHRRIGLACVALACVGLFVSCTSDPDLVAGKKEASGGAPIVIGSFDFSESRILAEIFGLALEDRGYPVTRLRNVASREVMEPALEQGFVDFVAEYQGTALTFLGLGRETPVAGTRETHRELTQVLGDRGIAVLDYAPAENKNEVVVTKATADRFQLRNISDLRAVEQELVIGGPPECPSRPLCLDGLQDTYGLRFKEFLPLDAGGPMTVAALEGGEVDVGILFTTSPAIPVRRLTVLEDNRNLQPAENIVPVVRKEVADAHGREFTEL